MSPASGLANRDMLSNNKISSTMKDIPSVSIPNQKKLFVKEVTVTLNKSKGKNHPRENSVPETTRKDIFVQNFNYNPSRKCKYLFVCSKVNFIHLDNNVKSRLFEPTKAYKSKKEATLTEKQKK